ncbi:MAG: tyrosine-type recombinase/integrase [Salinarimonas sp.]
MPKLTVRQVETMRKPGRYGDGGGLWLQVSPSGTKSWALRYSREGKARQMGLGAYPLVTLAMARERAIDERRKILAGFDPIAERRAERTAAKVEAAKAVTFAECAERYIAAHEATWRNPKHRAQWRATIAAYVNPVFGALPVAAVDTGLVMRALEPIWNEKPETAGRVRGRVELVLDWAAARGFRAGENPARWRGHLDKLLPARGKVAKVKHHAALPWQDAPAFMGELRAMGGVSPRALEFAILTAARTGEVIGARWEEVDLAAGVWTIPGERMKAGREHRVPLSPRAAEILSDAPREAGNPFVFIGGKRGAGLSNMAMLATLRRMGRGELTAHGFRSTFRDWAAEATAYPAEVAEMALAHTIESKVEAAYRRGDLFGKRRRLMAEWARHCERPAERAGGNVQAIREAV